MSWYERTYDTAEESDELDREAAIEQAYALGVAAALGDPPPEELTALTEAVGSAYERNVVELAYEEGRTEALAAADEETDNDRVWTDLVGDGPEAPPGEVSERSGTPDALDRPPALDRIEALDRTDLDSTEATELPEFLDRE